ncbi:MAG: DUF2971 domain-containing protein [Candidatus Entotheonellia bacterium]
MQDIWDNGIEWSEQLWRYLTTDRCVFLLESSLVYFAAATQFADRFEGAVAVQPHDFPIDPRYPELDTAEGAFRELKRLTKINCWHRADYESDAMWKLYAAQSKGIAICSTPDRMRAAFLPFRLASEYGAEDLWAGQVRYADLMKVRLKVSMLHRFFYKHSAFAWEREFRLAISVRTAEEFGVQVPELGIEVSVDLDALVGRIMLGPALSGTERDRIVQHAQRAGLGDRLVVSSLLGRPRYV